MSFAVRPLCTQGDEDHLVAVSTEHPCSSGGETTQEHPKESLWPKHVLWCAHRSAVNGSTSFQLHQSARLHLEVSKPRDAAQLARWTLEDVRGGAEAHDSDDLDGHGPSAILRRALRPRRSAPSLKNVLLSHSQYLSRSGDLSQCLPWH
jgi:hypothetical protein